jgi:hypothetical protein
VGQFFFDTDAVGGALLAIERHMAPLSDRTANRQANG